MEDIEERPLVSFCLFAYNQEKYIREAIEGAFSQTYSPLEIILSDDCSTDKTFEIMEEMAASYKGPHKIILNQNTQNLGGLIPHYNKVIEMAQGEFIVVAFGDDISLPNRTDRLADRWRESNYKKFILFHSGHKYIDSNGRFLEDVITPRYSDILNDLNQLLKQGAYAWGCTLAFPKSLFNFYGSINDGVFNEDTVMTFRASLLDGVVLISECLVEYRIGVGIGCQNNKGLSKEEKIKFKKKHAKHYYYTYNQQLSDFYKSNYKSDKIEIFIKKGIINKVALIFGIDNSFIKTIYKLPQFIMNGISIKIGVYIILFSFFKSFGVKRIPRFMLR